LKSLSTEPQFRRTGPGPRSRWNRPWSTVSALKAGATVSVGRRDDTTARFVVDKVAAYPKAQFPTTEVYGNNTTGRAALRLITCGGSFDDRSGHYVDNVVAFAHLVSANRPPRACTTQGVHIPGRSDTRPATWWSPRGNRPQPEIRPPAPQFLTSMPGVPGAWNATRPPAPARCVRELKGS
jgi:sortase family protein